MKARFDLTGEVIEPEALRRGLLQVEAGAFCGFEGWVRRKNEGREVVALRYEVYPALAQRQGERIVTEGFERFSVLAAHAVHRYGELTLGDVAVWVGVVAAHRRDAFAACQHIIDRIKEDVPIWKKERYADAPDRWIGAEPQKD